MVGSREGVLLQYKFIVDGEWKYAPDMPAMHDERNIINNVVEVQEYVPDHLDSLVGFEPPPSPPERSELITQPGPGSTFNFCMPRTQVKHTGTWLKRLFEGHGQATHILDARICQFFGALKLSPCRNC